jgi:hypothetical protein
MQMKDKEVDLNSKSQHLEELNRKNVELEKHLTELTLSSNKAQNPNQNNSTIQNIRQTLSEKNQIIEGVRCTSRVMQ